MLRLASSTQDYAWGSPTAIPDLLGVPAPGGPVAELWIGAHPSAPSVALTPTGPVGLDELVRAHPEPMLGGGVVARFGVTLPYLLKVLAAERPLSLQVHPSLEQARAGYAAEEAAGIPIDDPARNYKDSNHKPELVYALTTFQALCGFRAPRRAAELLDGLDAPLARELSDILMSEPTVAGVRSAFRRLLLPDLTPSRTEVEAVAQACARRLTEGSPSPRADRTVTSLARAYPGDPGVVTSLLLNPVTLAPGDAMFIPSGGVHAYLSGVAVEVLASSDNVLRAGLTSKHVDIPELLACVDYVAAPPIRIAPERFQRSTQVFYAPVDDFELSVTRVVDAAVHQLPGRGPRVLLCLEGSGTVSASSGEVVTLDRGNAVFVPASDGSLTVSGLCRLVQADVP